MNIETKDFPVIGFEPTDEYPNGSFEVILSAPTLDRDGEIIDTRAFEPLPDHITFDTDHSMTVDSVVGSGMPYYADDGTLRVKGGFAHDTRSQDVRRKVADGHIRTTSVTFMAAKREKDEKDVPHITHAELLNGTFTPIPSNRESTVLAAKSLLMTELKAGARNSSSDMQLLQAAHDALASLGAVCAADATPDDPASQRSTGAVDLNVPQATATVMKGEPGPELIHVGSPSAVIKTVPSDEGQAPTPDDESAATDKSAAEAVDESAATDEAPDEVKAALAARRNQIKAAFL